MASCGVPTVLTASSGHGCYVFMGVSLVGTLGAVSGLLGTVGDSMFVLIAVVTLTASQVGVRRFRPSTPWPWHLLALALVFFLVGGAVRQSVGSYGDLTSNRSLVPDIIVLPGYGLVAAAIAGFIRARSGHKGFDLNALLDCAVVSLAALALAWVHLIEPALMHDVLPLKVRLSLVVYPPLSVLLAAMTVRVSFTAGGRSSAAQRLFLSMMCLMVLGDTVQTIGDAHLASIPKLVADLPYALAFIAFGGTCLHPSMRGLCEPVPSDEVSPIRRRLVLIVASLSIPTLLSQLQSGAALGDRLVPGVIVVLLTGVGSWRVARAVHQHAASEARLLYQATHDELTGLPNRSLLLELIERRTSPSTQCRSTTAIMFVDLDRFKVINDTSGHAVGDELLIAVANRLRDLVGSANIVGRLGGDEFVVALVDAVGLPDAMAKGEVLLSAFREPFSIGGMEMYTSISVGLVLLGPDDECQDAETALQKADTAMYQAKAAGGDGLAVFDAAMRDSLGERVALGRDLRHALERGELRVYYQAIVSLQDERLEGFEALLRWVHTSRGLVPPATFIPIAEESGLILDIGTWVLDESLRQLQEWRTAGRIEPNVYVAVNLSARQLKDTNLLAKVTEALVHHGLRAEALCLELTESLVMEDPDTAITILTGIQRMGVKLSIDDFGTGYSSLSYLRRLPVDTVKIDKSFVDGLGGEDSMEETLVAAIVAMATALKKTTVAEGVETRRQADTLRSMGATRAQGYLYARPLPADVIPAVVDKLRSKSSACTERTAALLAVSWTEAMISGN